MLKSRGNFDEVRKALPSYHARGINSIYLMGALERDNCPKFDRYKEEVDFLKKDASPLSATSRAHANSMLGGEKKFKALVDEAKRQGVRVLVDCLSRVSSSRVHRKYRTLMLSTLDEEGKRTVCYGTDGRAVSYEDSAMLNYRKIETWNMHVLDVCLFV